MRKSNHRWNKTQPCEENRPTIPVFEAGYGLFGWVRGSVETRNDGAASRESGSRKGGREA